MCPDETTRASVFDAEPVEIDALYFFPEPSPILAEALQRLDGLRG